MRIKNMRIKNKGKIERTLRHCNSIHGGGMVLAIVWDIGEYAGITASPRGMVVRRMQYRLDAREFTVSDDYKTIRFLQHTRAVI